MRGAQRVPAPTPAAPRPNRGPASVHRFTPSRTRKPRVGVLARVWEALWLWLGSPPMALRRPGAHPDDRGPVRVVTDPRDIYLA